MDIWVFPTFAISIYDNTYFDNNIISYDNFCMSIWLGFVWVLFLWGSRDQICGLMHAR